MSPFELVSAAGAAIVVFALIVYTVLELRAHGSRFETPKKQVVRFAPFETLKAEGVDMRGSILIHVVACGEDAPAGSHKTPALTKVYWRSRHQRVKRSDALTISATIRHARETNTDVYITGMTTREQLAITHHVNTNKQV